MAQRESIDPRSPAFTNAFLSLERELRELPAEKVETPRLDVDVAFITVLGLAPRIAAMRPEIARKFGEAQAAHVDRIETIARAAGNAHAAYKAHLLGSDLEPLAKDVAEMRRTLFVDATSLVNRKLVDGRLLQQLEGGTSYKGLCADVLQLVVVFREHMATIRTETPVTIAELDRAESLANQLATAIGKREAGTDVSAAADMARRAWTLLFRTWEEIRRIVGYVRWKEDDADEIAPSLYAGRSSPKRGDDVSVTPPPANGTPIAPGMPGAPAFST